MNAPLRKKDRNLAGARSAPKTAALQSEMDLDATLEASFPASDPPGWTLGASKTVATATVHENDRENSAGAQKLVSKSYGDYHYRERCNSACVEFPDWMNEEPLCREAQEITVFGKRVILPIFPT